MPDVGGLLPQYIADGIIAVAVAPGAGEDYYTEFHVNSLKI
jgi:hypothetical protein